MDGNKFTLNGKVIIDLTNDNVLEEDVRNGKIFHKADGSVCVGTADMGGEEWIGDGKSHLWIEIGAEGGIDVSLYFYQSVSNGVTIDWGDGSATETVSSNMYRYASHTYTKSGKYIITLDAAEGCSLEFGDGNSTGSVMGTSSFNRCTIKKLEIGGDVSSIGRYAFNGCGALTDVKILDGVKYTSDGVFKSCDSLVRVELPNSLTSIGTSAFTSCYSLQNIKLPDSLTLIDSNAFQICPFTHIEFPSSVKTIKSYAFDNCTNMKVYDFTKHTAVPTLGGTNTFNKIPADCEIRVPAALVDEWKAATNWSTYASQIVGV